MRSGFSCRAMEVPTASEVLPSLSPFPSPISSPLQPLTLRFTISAVSPFPPSFGPSLLVVVERVTAVAMKTCNTSPPLRRTRGDSTPNGANRGCGTASKGRPRSTTVIGRLRGGFSQNDDSCTI